MASIDNAINQALEEWQEVQQEWNLDQVVAIRYALINAILEEFLDVSAPRIISGFRDPNKNRRVGGVPNSQHLVGRAIDLQQGGQLGTFVDFWEWFGGRWGGRFTDPSPGHFDLGS